MLWQLRPLRHGAAFSCDQSQQKTSAAFRPLSYDGWKGGVVLFETRRRKRRQVPPVRRSPLPKMRKMPSLCRANKRGPRQMLLLRRGALPQMRQMPSVRPARILQLRPLPPWTTGSSGSSGDSGTRGDAGTSRTAGITGMPRTARTQGRTGDRRHKRLRIFLEHDGDGKQHRAE